MKKTIIISIAKRSFQIEEDAYELLNAYIRNLEAYFRKTDPDGEILLDIEERIAELFLERKQLGIEVLTIKEVSDVVERVGSVEEIAEADELSGLPLEEEVEAKKSSEQPAVKAKQAIDYSKTYYRHPTDHWIGGVLGGLSSYFKVDSTLLRIIFIALLLSPISFDCLILYLAALFFLPKATTIGELLEMEGEEVTANSIWEKISRNKKVGKEPGAVHPLGSSLQISPEQKMAKESSTGLQQKKGCRSRTGLLLMVIVLLILLVLTYQSITQMGIAQGLFFNHGSLGFWDLMYDKLGDVKVAMGALGIFILLPILLLVLVSICGIMALAVVPVGLIMRQPNWQLLHKAILILLWLIFVHYLF